MNPDSLPILSGANYTGHLDELKNDRFGMFDRFNRECGDIGHIRALSKSITIANTPELLHEVLVEKAKHFIKSPGLRGPLKPLAGEGLFTSEGELWRRQRRSMAPLFTHGAIAGYADCMAECAERAADRYQPGMIVDMARETTGIAMRIAGKTLFDADTLDDADELGEALTVALAWANDQAGSLGLTLQIFLSRLIKTVSAGLPGPLDPLRARGLALAESLIEPIRWPGDETRRLERALAIIEGRVERMIADRRAAGLARRDLLSLLLAAQDDDGAKMSDKQVRDEIVTLFVAGHETTATALAWSLYLLAKHPDAYARAKAEATAFAGRSIVAADLPRLGYCQRVFKEAMRLYPPVYFFGRQAIADVTIGGYDFPNGSVILFSLYALHRREALWPDPLRFDPARFEPAAEEARHRQAYAPFSAGPRTCIGNHFALMEGPIVLATLLARADFALATDAPVEPEASATMRPKGGVPMRITAVHAPPAA